ncbi:signal peptidase I [Nocardioides marmoribigeumensis]|uniref:Signal peptidase I n=1 Tax=Nocardioides marmoribigeumensis TaxID=433649 RepID=A0ABU2BUY7_9ACTN|nr:signal peptidase I [Nocardioides marmoribigeumensis]MDR7362446.1 signal peptidase I [Nocardioides marmoribigeumensis]
MRRSRPSGDPSPVGPDGGPAATRKRRHVPASVEAVVLLVLALLLALGIKTFLVQMFFVPSESMEPLFIKNDRIMVEKWSYWSSPVRRGDVVVFEDPGGWLGPPPPLNPVQKGLSTIGLYPTGGHLVKRVIGVGGDRVACCDPDGRLTVNGVPLVEDSYVKKGSKPSDRDFSVTVPKGRLWVMGDNRSNSEDSRYHRQLPGGGTVPESAVVGKVWAIVWPISRWDHIETPRTFDQKALAQE